MLHPDFMLQIAKQQQMEYIKISEQARIASQNKAAKSNEFAILPALLDWIGGRLILLFHRSRKLSCNVPSEQACACNISNCSVN